MTDQVKDTIFFNGKFYYIVEIMSQEYFFDPTSLGYAIYPISSCCWCGYNVKYKIDQSANLLINELILSADSADVHPINNVEPKLVQKITGNILYENLNLPVNYTGIILIAEDYNYHDYNYTPKFDHIKSLYDKDKYVNPIELTFINGKLVSYLDI